MFGKKILNGRIAAHYAESRVAKSAFMGRHGIIGGAAKTMSRHPVIVGAVGLGYAANLHASYGNMPGPNISQRNQNSRVLRNIRSSGANGLQSRSMGGYA